MEHIYNQKEHLHFNDSNEISIQYAIDSITLAGLITSNPIRCKNDFFLYTIKIPYATSDDMYISASLETGYSMPRKHHNLFFVLTDKIISKNSFIRIENGRYIVSDLSELIDIQVSFNTDEFYKCNVCGNVPNTPIRIYAIYTNSIFVMSKLNGNPKQFKRLPISLYEKSIHISSCHAVFRLGGMHHTIDGIRPTYAYIVNGSSKFRIIFSPKCKIPKNINRLSLIDLFGDIVILTKKIPIICPTCGNSYDITNFKPLFVINNII